MLYGVTEAIAELYPSLVWVEPSRQEEFGVVGNAFLVDPYDGTTYDDVNWYNMGDTPIPSRDVLEEKINELNTNEAMRLLRKERDRLIAETDWWASSDLTMSSERTTYRQALRDLPASSSPTLDDEGELLLSSVTWPTKPS